MYQIIKTFYIQQSSFIGLFRISNIKSCTVPFCIVIKFDMLLLNTHGLLLDRLCDLLRPLLRCLTEILIKCTTLIEFLLQTFKHRKYSRIFNLAIINPSIFYVTKSQKSGALIGQRENRLICRGTVIRRGRRKGVQVDLLIEKIIKALSPSVCHLSHVQSRTIVNF